MKKRIAYIGLSYPLLYDYKNQARHFSRNSSDFPNPIIENPVGLMILYDEIWFLCENVCPSNMKRLPYVKFVDKEYPDIPFEQLNRKADEDRQLFIDKKVKENQYPAILFENKYIHKVPFEDITKSFNIDNNYIVDNHTHAIRLGTASVTGNATDWNFAFDLYIFEELQKRERTSAIELVSNRFFCVNTDESVYARISLVEQLIISNIPNYLSVNGPYHPCMDELRENRFLSEFRKWVAEEHSNIQRNEIKELCGQTERAIQDAQEEIFLKYLHENSGFRTSLSVGKTIIVTGLGFACPFVSVADAVVSAGKDFQTYSDAKKHQWQGYILESRSALQSKLK